MKKTTLYIVIAVTVLLIAAGIGIYFYTQKKKKKTTEPPKKLGDVVEKTETPVSKPYDGEARALVDAFFKSSGLGVEQQAAVLETAQENIKKYGKADGVMNTLAQWMPAWMEDPQHAEIKEKIQKAWEDAYKKWSELKAKNAL